MRSFIPKTTVSRPLPPVSECRVFGFFVLGEGAWGRGLVDRGMVGASASGGVGGCPGGRPESVVVVPV